MELHVGPYLHREARPGINAVDLRLRSSPNAETSGDSTQQGTRRADSRVKEQVPATDTHDATLAVCVEGESERQWSIVNSRFGEKGEGISSAARAADCLPPFGGEPQGNASYRLDSNARGHFDASAADFGTRPSGERDPTIDIIDQPNAGLAGAKLPIICKRMRSRDCRILAAQQCPA